MKVTQISIGRFHHFHLARQLERHQILDTIWTGYPLFKLKDEEGIPRERIHTYPWLHAPYMSRGKFKLDGWKWLNKEWAWWDHETLDRHVASALKRPTVLVGLSGSGLHAGKVAQQMGGFHICDRGSSHIRFQDEILQEEYARWGAKFQGVDPRTIAKEEAEYRQADRITVPSEFVKNSFLKMGVPESKIDKVVYGARLERFKKVADVIEDCFRVLWVGGVSIRKGFLDLLQAFIKLKHVGKELLVIGSVAPEIEELLKNYDLSNVIFKGLVPNAELPRIYSQSNVFVLPSIEEGLAMVLGEAMACGCPVIASIHTGAEDIVTDGVEGFIIPIRSESTILDRLELLAQDKKLQQKMSEAALSRVKKMGGWDAYGDDYVNVIKSL